MMTEEVESACQCRCDSSSESESSGASSEPKLRIWWARVLRESLKQAQLEAIWPQDCVKIMNSCTGCCAEAVTLKAG